MSAPTVRIFDSTTLPKPSYEAQYERGLVSDYYEVQRGYHVMRRNGTLTSYLVYTVSGQGFFRDRDDRSIVVGRGDLVLIEPPTSWRRSPPRPLKAARPCGTSSSSTEPTHAVAVATT